MLELTDIEEEINKECWECATEYIDCYWEED
jgi:hypothetical protein